MITIFQSGVDFMQDRNVGNLATFLAIYDGVRSIMSFQSEC